MKFAKAISDAYLMPFDDEVVEALLQLLRHGDSLALLREEFAQAQIDEIILESVREKIEGYLGGGVDIQSYKDALGTWIDEWNVHSVLKEQENLGVTSDEPAPAQKTEGEESSEEDVLVSGLLPVFLEESEAHVSQLTSSFRGGPAEALRGTDWNTVFRSAHTIKGSSASVGLRRLSKTIHNFEETLSRQREEFSLKDSQAEVLALYSQSLEWFLRSFGEVILEEFEAEIAANEGIEFSAVQGKSDDLRLGFSLLESLSGILSGLDTDEELAEIRERLTVLRSKKKARKEESFRVSAKQLNSLFHQLETMSALISQSERKVTASSFLSASCADDDLSLELKSVRDILREQRSLSGRLQKNVVSLQLAPFRGVVGRLRKTCDDYLASSSKKIEVEFRGEKTEIKKTILERLTDILLHLVKNSLDHGIEESDVRVRSGKPEQGKLLVSARNSRCALWIDVEDDGKGMDPAVIRSKAVEKGVISEEVATQLTDQEAIELIFAPGFSTASSVTSVSGRGVGMDAVRSMVEDLNGTLTLKSTKGQGSCTTICFRVNTSVEEVITLESNSQSYAIPVEEIESIIELESSDLENIKAFPWYEVQEKLYPILSIEALVSKAEAKEQDCSLLRPIERDFAPVLILVSENGKMVALFCNKVIGKEQVIVNPVPTLLEADNGVSGFFKTRAGGVGAVLHPIDLACDFVTQGLNSKELDLSSGGKNETRAHTQILLQRSNNAS